MKKFSSDIVGLIKTSVLRWMEDECPRLGATLSYYVVFSIAPLILLSIAIGGLVFDQALVRGEMVTQLAGLFGAHASTAIETLLEASYKPTAGIVSTFLGLLALLLGASGVVIEMQEAINKIWRIKEESAGLRDIFKKRLLSMGMVLATGFLLLVSLVMSAVLAAMGKYLGGVLSFPEIVMHVVIAIGSFVIVTCLFMSIYKMFPSTEVTWRSVWPGALITSILFAAGKFFIGLYLGKSTMGSSYGAAGSFIVLLVWVYYSAQIFYLGAEFTKVLAERSATLRPS